MVLPKPCSMSSLTTKAATFDVGNAGKYCVFYNVEKQLCKVYKYRPLGCRIYPVIFVEGKGVVVDDLCPSKHTVSTAELQQKGKILRKLLKRIDAEAEKRVLHKSIKKA